MCSSDLDYSSDVILNSNENGIQYLHKFTVNHKGEGKERFKITETKREYGTPIVTPKYQPNLYL